MSFDFDCLDEADEHQEERKLSEARLAGFVPERPLQKIANVWCVSDAHCDHDENYSFFLRMSSTKHKDDILILAGDISHELNVLHKTLRTCKEKFAEVFFVPGNHELWVTNDSQYKGIPEEEREYCDSFAKLKHILRLCEHLGVRTRPQVYASGGESLWVVPLLSYHARSFDTEPEITDHWEGIGPLEGQVRDFSCSVWPDGMDPATDAVADAIDSLNDSWGKDLPPDDQRAFECVVRAGFEERATAHTSIVSFSHFLPDLRLNPEKRFLFYPNINKAIGSNALKHRVEVLQPNLHVFGHTHFGWDLVLGNTRFVQAPLSMPKERSSFSVTVIGDFPDFDDHRPLLLRDAAGTWAAPYQAGWSEYYKAYPREAHRTAEIQAKMMQIYHWRGPGSPPNSDLCFAGRRPGWELAPTWVFMKLRSKAPGFDGAKHNMMKDKA